MRFLLTVFVTLFLLAGPAIAAAQTGTLTGRVLEPDTRAPVSGATVTVQGADAEAITDAGGNYELELEPGTYTLEVEAGADFESRTIEDIEVTADQATPREITLARSGGTEAAEFGEYTVRSGYIEGSPASVVTTVRDAEQVTDAIGSEQMEAVGDSNAAEALKRLPGLTIEQGKYVSIRGQPKRYTKTTFNGSPLPSPDPLKRLVPLDLFPSGVLSQIEVTKSYDAALPGSFGAGAVDLQTVGLPQETFFEISAKVGGNTESTGEDGRDHEGGDTDFLGIDDDTRELPNRLDSQLSIARRSDQQTLENGARSLPNVWQAESETLPPDYGLGVAAGTTGEFAGADLGVRGSLNWSQEWRQQDRVDRLFTASQGQLVLRDDLLRQQTDRNVDVGAFATASLDWGKHQLTSNSFLLRNTRQRTQVTEGTTVISDELEVRNTLLDWNERESAGQQFVGEHDFPALEVTWRAMLAEAERDNPDRRRSSRVRGVGRDNPFSLSDQATSSRRWLDTVDEVGSFSIDLKRTVLDSKRWGLDVKGGVSTYSQLRSTNIRTLGLEVENGSGLDRTKPTEELLRPENIGNGISVSDETDEIDLFAGQALVDAAYVKADVKWRDTLRVVAGVRREEADFTVVTFNQDRDAEIGGFDETDSLPSLSTTWFFAEDMQARFALGRSVSRPRLNEISDVQYTDPDTDFDFQGNPDLTPAEIDSLDLRWEWYPSAGELVSFGVFAKDYTDPLEVTFLPEAGASKRRQVQNADEATVEGIEANARVNLPRITGLFGADWDWTENVYVQGNFALIDSEVTTSDEFATNQEHPLQGQADEIANLNIGYQGGLHNFSVALNFTGDRLTTVGVQGKPDIIQEARTQLDVGYDYQWGEQLDLSVNADNLLDEEVERTQGGQQVEGFDPGVGFSVSLNYGF